LYQTVDYVKVGAHSVQSLYGNGTEGQ